MPRALALNRIRIMYNYYISLNNSAVAYTATNCILDLIVVVVELLINDLILDISYSKAWHTHVAI